MDTKILNSLTSDIHSGKNPRYGRRGRIPNSLNIPFHELVDSKSGKFKNIKELSKLFSDKKIFTNIIKSLITAEEELQHL